MYQPMPIDRNTDPRASLSTVMTGFSVPASEMRAPNHTMVFHALASANTRFHVSTPTACQQQIENDDFFFDYFSTNFAPK